MSNVIEQMSSREHEMVTFCNDQQTGLKAIIAIHNTTLGPSLGGCRFYPYAEEGAALNDALRLSRGMTYKSAISGLNLGGGKSVIIGNPSVLASEALFRAFGRNVNSLNGRYITAEDVGTNSRFMEWVHYETEHVVGIPPYLGGCGDPGPFTAHGTFCGIKASLKYVKGNDSLAGVKIAVEGIGSVGYNLCKELHAAGAKLFVCDVNPDATARAASEFGATVVTKDALYGLDVDVYAPCALGATLNDVSIPQLKCSIVAGAANNQLEDEKKHGEAISKRGILLAPDYVINAGGVVAVYCTEVINGTHDLAWARTEDIYATLLKIFDVAAKENISTAMAANKLAEQRIQAVGRVKNIYRGCVKHKEKK